MNFKVHGVQNHIEVFTSRVETICEVTFLAVSPESPLVDEFTTPDRVDAVTEFLSLNSKRSERDRLADLNNTNGVFTGSWVINPINGKQVPVWVADYVIATYGTGAVMAVPAHDDRDRRFANKYGLEQVTVIDESNTLVNSLEFTGMKTFLGKKNILNKLLKANICNEKTSYKMRDAVFGRQRYWGEPIPVYYDDGIPKLVPVSELPVVLPEVENYKPTSTGQPPLGHAADWLFKGKYPYELSTMPGWAGSSWYFLRYMEPDCNTEIASRNSSDYWASVDLYMGGSEHATGHLLYSRFWNMFLYDLGCVSFEEPFKKIVNQGMIEGKSALIHRVVGENKYVSSDISDNYITSQIHISSDLVDGSTVLVDKLRAWRVDFLDSEFIFNGDTFLCEHKIEKMSKSKHNVTNPNDVISVYGADIFRMYEMYLGPITQSKPWSISGIDGLSRFLKRFISIYQTETGISKVVQEAPTQSELELLHVAIKKVSEDIEKLNHNTAIAALMICVNGLIKEKCHKCEILTPLAIIASPFIVYVTQELWVGALKQTGNIFEQALPIFNEANFKKVNYCYPISINGKVRANITFDLDASEESVTPLVLENEKVKKWIADKPVKKVILVKGKIVNVVI